MTSAISTLKTRIEKNAKELGAQDSLAEIPPFPFLPHQLEIAFDTHKNIVLSKGRRWGGTTLMVGRIMGMAQAGLETLWIDTSYRAIMRYWRKYFAPYLKPLDNSLWKWNQQLMLLSFYGGGSIEFGSAEKPELLEGAGYGAIGINEAGIVLRNEDLYYNTLLPMGIENEGAFWFFNGTPKGKGLFHTLYNRGRDSLEPDWSSYQRSSYENPILNVDLLQRFTQDMPEHVYNQEILAQFISEGGDFFQSVDAAIDGLKEEAPNPSLSYVAGIDVAKSLDYTVIWIGRTDTRKGVACRRFNKMPWKETVRRIKEMVTKYNNAQVCIDATGVGAPIVEDLTSEGISIHSDNAIIFTNASKNAILNRLSSDIEHAKVKFFKHKETIAELVAFERKMLPSGNWRLEAPSGGHDDTVIALALMNWIMPSFGDEFDVGSLPGIHERMAEELVP